MQVTETSSEGLKRAFKVVVDAAEIETKTQAKLADIGSKVNIPGFRPGKIPPSVLKQRYGQAVMGEVVEEVVSESATKTISERDLKPALQPKIEIDSFDEGKDLEYTMEVELLPEFDVMDLSKLELERLKVKVGDQEVNEAIERILESRKDSEPADKAAEEGDIAVIDFVGKIDGVSFDGGSAEGHQLELGSGTFIPGFEEQLVGVKAGDEKEVTVKFPDDYRAEHLAGKEAVFEVKVQEVRKTVPATLNDDLAKSFGQDSVDDLKAAIRGEIENDYNGVARMRVKRQLLDALADEHEFTVPDGMVESEFEQIWKQFDERRKNNPDEIDDEDKEKSDDELKEEYREIAARRVRLGLVLAEIGDDNDIDVSKDEVTRAILQEAQRYPGRENEVFEYFQKNESAIAGIRAPIYEEKVVDYILELAKVTDKEVSPEELLKITQEEADADKA